MPIENTWAGYNAATSQESKKSSECRLNRPTWLFPQLIQHNHAVIGSSKPGMKTVFRKAV